MIFCYPTIKRIHDILYIVENENMYESEREKSIACADGENKISCIKFYLYMNLELSREELERIKIRFILNQKQAYTLWL